MCALQGDSPRNAMSFLAWKLIEYRLIMMTDEG